VSQARHRPALGSQPLPLSRHIEQFRTRTNVVVLLDVLHVLADVGRGLSAFRHVLGQLLRGQSGRRDLQGGRAQAAAVGGAHELWAVRSSIQGTSSSACPALVGRLAGCGRDETLVGWPLTLLAPPAAAQSELPGQRPLRPQRHLSTMDPGTYSHSGLGGPPAAGAAWPLARTLRSALLPEHLWPSAAPGDLALSWHSNLPGSPATSCEARPATPLLPARSAALVTLAAPALRC